MREIGPSRRQLLGGILGAGLTATAGCLGLNDNSPDEDTGEELRLSLSRIDGQLRDVYVHERDDPDEQWDRDALEAALNSEPYTRQYRKPFFSSSDEPAYVVDNGTYYQVGSVIVDERTETHPVLRLFEAADATESAVDGSEEGTLPEPDQRAVHIAHMAARQRGNKGGMPAGLVQRGGYVYRNETARSESDLLSEDGPKYVTFRGTTYAVDISQEQFFEPVYRPTAEQVADSPDQMETILKATYVGSRVSQDDLSVEAQDVVEEARVTEYSERHPFSDAYTELLRALDKRAYIDGNIRKDAGVRSTQKKLLQYEDTYYDYVLRFVRNSGT